MSLRSRARHAERESKEVSKIVNEESLFTTIDQFVKTKNEELLENIRHQFVLLQKSGKLFDIKKNKIVGATLFQSNPVLALKLFKVMTGCLNNKALHHIFALSVIGPLMHKHESPELIKAFVSLLWRLYNHDYLKLQHFRAILSSGLIRVSIVTSSKKDIFSKLYEEILKEAVSKKVLSQRNIAAIKRCFVKIDARARVSSPAEMSIPDLLTPIEIAVPVPIASAEVADPAPPIIVPVPAEIKAAAPIEIAIPVPAKVYIPIVDFFPVASFSFFSKMPWDREEPQVVEDAKYGSEPIFHKKH